MTYTVEAGFNGLASGSYQFSVTGAAGTNGQAVVVTGLPITGATETISSATATATATVPVNQVAVVAPNPSTGGTLNVLPADFSGISDVNVKVYTTAFRLVKEKNYYSQAYGMVHLEPMDNWGTPLASGLYYVVVETKKGRSVAKLLILH